MEPPRSLSAKYESDFAYHTVKDRLPVILSRVADTVYRMGAEIEQRLGQAGLDDLKSIVAGISKLRNEVQTNKPVLPLTDGGSDEGIWNAYLDKESSASPAPPSWFSSAWLYVECYVYRRIQEAVLLSCHLKDLDVFGGQKQDAFHDSLEAMSSLARHLQLSKELGTNHEAAEKGLQAFLRIALWGNKCDLSVSNGQSNSQTSDLITQLAGLEKYILVDDSDQVLRTLQEAAKKTPNHVRLDVVLDNAGFEVFTDFILADFLLSTGLVHTVHFHVKAIPWFVSDVTTEDFHWTLNQLCSAKDRVLQDLGAAWKKHVEDQTWVVHVHDFWTSPYYYSKMQEVAPDLYGELGKAQLVILKGDLNYRKLVRDLKWDMSTPFVTALGGFLPAPLCALRTLKADVVVGVKVEVTKPLEDVADWMVKGEYAVIQAASQ